MSHHSISPLCLCTNRVSKRDTMIVSLFLFVLALAHALARALTHAKKGLSALVHFSKTGIEPVSTRDYGPPASPDAYLECFLSTASTDMFFVVVYFFHFLFLFCVFTMEMGVLHPCSQSRSSRERCRQTRELARHNDEYMCVRHAQ